MPLISVIIPTRNRNSYLIDSIQIALKTVNDLEIIVCDNSDTDVLRELLFQFNSTNKVKYLYSSENLSVVDNFERAFRASTGDYLISIGDDDAIGPGIEEIALWAKENSIDSVISYSDSFIASYYWPGVKSKYFGDSYASSLFVNRFTGNVFKISSNEAIAQVANRLGGGLGKMPRAYHGLVARSLVEKIWKKHGFLFGGVSPDIFSATLIAGYCVNPVHIDFPFVIPGASPVSTAGQGAERSDRGNINTTDHTARFGKKLIWDKRIPEFYSPHTVWAYSFCKAVDLLPQLKIKPNFGRLYACCFLYSRNHHRELFQAMRFLCEKDGRFKTISSFIFGLATEIGGLLKKIALRILNPRAGGSATRLGPYNLISDAFTNLSKFVNENKKKPILKKIERE